MSSFNNITKIKYAPHTAEVVSLSEYILFEDERAEEKYVVFKFINNVNQQLLGFEFEVNEYGDDGELIEKTVLVYNKFSAKAQQAFVPKAKLKVDFACKTLSVKLRKAAFDRFIWNDGEYEDFSYKFSHYLKDEEVEAQLNELKELKERNGKKQKPKKKEKKLPEREEIVYEPSFAVKNKTRMNIPIFPAVFGVFICIVVVAYIAVTLALFMQSSKRFSLEGFDLRVISGVEVSVYGYDGGETELEIPATIAQYKITKIETGAFKNSPVQTVTLGMNSVIIESGAFEGCANLRLVTAAATTRVVMYENSFIDCYSGLTLLTPNSITYPAPAEQ